MATVELIQYDQLIGGRCVSGLGDQRESIDPATETAWSLIPDASLAQVDDAVAVARASLQGEWSRVLPRQRGVLLRRVADLIENRSERLIASEIRDNGKTIRELAGQYQLIPEFYRYFAELADKLDGRVLPPERPGVLNYTLV